MQLIHRLIPSENELPKSYAKVSSYANLSESGKLNCNYYCSNCQAKTLINDVCQNCNSESSSFNQSGQSIFCKSFYQYNVERFRENMFYIVGFLGDDLFTGAHGHNLCLQSVETSGFLGHLTLRSKLQVCVLGFGGKVRLLQNRLHISPGRQSYQQTTTSFSRFRCMRMMRYKAMLYATIILVKQRETVDNFATQR